MRNRFLVLFFCFLHVFIFLLGSVDAATSLPAFDFPDFISVDSYSITADNRSGNNGELAANVSLIFKDFPQAGAAKAVNFSGVWSKSSWSFTTEDTRLSASLAGNQLQFNQLKLEKDSQKKWVLSGSAAISCPDRSVLKSVFGNATPVLNFRISSNGFEIFSQPDWKTSISTFGSSGPIFDLSNFRIVKEHDKWQCTSSGSVKINGSSFSGNFGFADSSFSFETPDFSLFGLNNLALDLSMPRRTDGKFDWAGEISGTMPKASIGDFFTKLGLKTPSLKADLPKISGHFNTAENLLEISGMPLPDFGLPGFFKISSMEKFTFLEDKNKKTTNTTLLVNLDFPGVLSGLKVILSFEKKSGNSSDISFSLAQDSTAVFQLPKNGGVFSFKSLSGGRYSGKWSIGGEMDYALPDNNSLTTYLGSNPFPVNFSVVDGKWNIATKAGWSARLNLDSTGKNYVNFTALDLKHSADSPLEADASSTIKLEVLDKPLDGQLSVSDGHCIITVANADIGYVKGVTLRVTVSRESSKFHWQADFSGAVDSGSLVSMFDSLGFGKVPISRSYEVQGSFGSEIMSITFPSGLPSLPFSFPDWMPVMKNPVSSLSITREMSGKKRMICDFDIDVDLKKLKDLFGFSSDLPAFKLSGIAGPGLSVPSFSASGSNKNGATGKSSGSGSASSSSSNSGSNSWFAECISSDRFSWLGSSQVSSNESSSSGGALGIVFGSPAFSGTMPEISLPGGGNFGLSKIIGGKSSDGWHFSGKLNLNLPVSFTSLARNITIPSMDFSYDGGLLSIVSPDQIPFSLAGMDTRMTGFTIARNAEKNWEFSGLASIQTAGHSVLKSVFNSAPMDFNFRISANGMEFFSPPAWSASIPAIGGSGPVFGLSDFTIKKKDGKWQFACAGSMSINGRSFPGAFSFSENTYSFQAPDFSLMGLDSLDLDLAMTRQSDGKFSWSGHLSGDLPKASIENFYSDLGLTVPVIKGSLPSISGTFSPDRNSIELFGMPLPSFGLPNYLAITDLEKFSISEDKKAGKTVTTLLVDLDFPGVFNKLKVNAEFARKNSGSPDVIFSLALPDGQDITLPDSAGTLKFTGLTGGRINGKWDLSGSIEYSLPERFAFNPGNYSLPRKVAMTFGVNDGKFVGELDCNQEIPFFPGIPFKLESYRLQQVDGKMAFGLTCSINGHKGMLGFSTSGVVFKADTPISFSHTVKDPAGNNVAEVSISNLDLSITNSKFALDGSAAVSLSNACFFSSIFNLSASLEAKIHGEPGNFTITFDHIGFKPELNLGKIGKISFDVDSFSLSSDGKFSLAGNVVAFNKSFVFSGGTGAKGPFFDFDLGNDGIDISWNRIFHFDIRKKVSLSQVIGIKKFTVSEVGISLGDAKKPLLGISGSNLSWWMTPGFLFFDKLSGDMNIAGFAMNLDVGISEPKGEEDLKILLDALTKQNFAPLKNLSAPAFSLSNFSITLPEVLKRIFRSNGKLILVNKLKLEIKDLFDLADALNINKLIDLLLAKIGMPGKLNLQLAGFRPEASVGIDKHGIKVHFKLIIKNSHVDAETEMQGLIGTHGNFSFGPNAGTLKVKSGGHWKTLSNTRFTLTNNSLNCSASFEVVNGMHIDVGGEVKNNEFSLTGHLSKMKNGTGFDGDYTISRNGPSLHGQIKVNNHVIRDGTLKIENGKVICSTDVNGLDIDIFGGKLRLSFVFDLSFGIKDHGVGISGYATVKEKMVGQKNWSPPLRVSTLSLDGHKVKASVGPFKLWYDLKTKKGGVD